MENRLVHSTEHIYQCLEYGDCPVLLIIVLSHSFDNINKFRQERSKQRGQKMSEKPLKLRVGTSEVCLKKGKKVDMVGEDTRGEVVGAARQ